MSWLDGFYLYLGRCAPGDASTNSIKNALLNAGSVCVICVSDGELCKIKSNLKKVESNTKQITIFDKGTSNEIGSLVDSLKNKENNEVSFIRPSQIKLARSCYQDSKEKDLEKHKKAIEKMKVLQENSKKRAELQRQIKAKEMLAKEEQLNLLAIEANDRLQEELRKKDFILHLIIKEDEQFEEI